MNEKKREDIIGMLVIRVPLRSHSIDIPGARYFLNIRREFQFLTF